MRPEALGRMRARSPMEGGSAGSSRRRWFSLEVLRYAALSWGAIVVLLPLLWMVVTSLKPISAVFSTTWDPKEAEWANYLRALRAAPFGRYFLNTAFVAVDSFAELPKLLRRVERGLGGTLSAFEVLWQDFYRLVTTEPATAVSSRVSLPSAPLKVPEMEPLAPITKSSAIEPPERRGCCRSSAS